jgi:hydrogenase maturation protease
MAAEQKILVVAIGNEYRSDDSLGLALLKQLQAAHQGAYETLVLSSDPSDLIGRWDERTVIVLDACQSSPQLAGTVEVFRPLTDDRLCEEKFLSSHALGLQQAFELGRLMGSIPGELIVVAIEGQNFSPGLALSALAEKSLEKALPLLLDLILEKEANNA